MKDLRYGLEQGKAEIVARAVREYEDRVLHHKGPGPEERRWRNRLAFKLTGRWPQSVVDERLHMHAERVRIERKRRENA